MHLLRTALYCFTLRAAGREIQYFLRLIIIIICVKVLRLIEIIHKYDLFMKMLLLKVNSANNQFIKIQRRNLLKTYKILNLAPYLGTFLLKHEGK